MRTHGPKPNIPAISAMGKSSSVPVIDLFAGPGGLGEGFTALRRESRARFKVRLSIEKDPVAHQTLQLRAFYRQFAPGRVPGLYYDVLRGATSREALFARFPEQSANATHEAWHAELGETPDRQVRERIEAAIGAAETWVLIGGPPCQAYSVAGRSRNKGIQGYSADEDKRQFLYEQYLAIIADHWPAIFVMENVKGLLSATLLEQRMFERIHEDLADPARAVGRRGSGRRHRYNLVSISDQSDLSGRPDVARFVVQTERYGIPQARHRVILVGVRDDLLLPQNDAEFTLSGCDQTPLRQVLDRLPALRSGLSKSQDSPRAWRDAIRDARGRRWIRSAASTGGQDVHDLIVETIDHIGIPRHDRGGEFVSGDYRSEYEPEWFFDGRIEGICNHHTRCHMARDLHRYLYAACYSACHGISPRLKHFPTDLLPDHRNVALALNGHGFFGDRFRVQVRNKPSTTVTSHLAKDGHAFIHPDPAQCRTLTVREAARLQTFPDNYLFCGPRSQQYVQVGNAVPPILARAIASIVWKLLSRNGLAD